MVAKLAAIGYILLTTKDRNVSRAVVAMDGKQSEIGVSNGGSGKSLLGLMFKQVMPTISVNGKTVDFLKDNFTWDEMTVKTRWRFIDDVRTNFPFEHLFSNITGDWTVNYKGERRATIPFERSPKIYVTTNHALNGDGSSFDRRQWKIAFSDFYNETHQPQHDFGALFFDEWDFEQWNLLWNMLAECVQIYFKHGVVQAPSDRIEQRQLRQFMGENFLSWADEYFSDDTRRNQRIPRKEIYDKFLSMRLINGSIQLLQISSRKSENIVSGKDISSIPHKYDTTGICMFFDNDGKASG